MPFGYSIYFVERGANRVVKWNPDNGDADVVAGEPSPKDPDQELRGPYGLAFDAGGSLLVADKLNHRICRVKQGRLSKVAWRDATGHRTRRPDSPPRFKPDELFCPTSLLQELDGTLLAGFYDDNTIYRIKPDGRLELVLGLVADRPRFIDAPLETVPPSELGSYPVRGPVGIVERTDGTIFYIERRIQMVREFHPSRGVRSLFPMSQVQEWRRRNAAPERGRMTEYYPPYPSSLALDGGERLHLCEVAHGCVFRLDVAKGTFERVLERPRPSQSPRDSGISAVTFGPDGTAWVADSGSQSIHAYSVDAGGKWTLSNTVLTGVRKERLRLLSGGMGMVTGS